MPILVTRKQLTFEKLAEGLLTARASKAQLADATEALRRANPGLDVRRVAAGTPVVVPPLRNARVDVSAVGRRIGEDLADPGRSGGRSSSPSPPPTATWSPDGSRTSATSWPS